MEVETEDSVIQSCLRKIESQLGWGNGEEWSTQDFESLSKKIQESTGVALSVATLKRIWGKIKYDSKPTVTTLNALAQFVGYENWRTYKQNHPANGKSNGHDKNYVPNHYPEKKRSSRVWIILAGIVVVGLSVLLVVLSISSEREIDPAPFQFNSKKVVDVGVPNSVIFDYDATAATEGDSVFIQQSWDKRLSTLVNRNEHQHTSIYYYPGFFAAKLRINETVVKEHLLVINTDGWLPLIEQNPVPVYFKEQDAQQHGSFGLTIDQIIASNVDLQPQPPRVAYFKVGDFGDVTTHDLIIETQFKNDYSEGANACQFSEIVVLFEGGALVVPFSAKGCVSELNFMDKEGKKSDLSMLGCDFSNWINVKIEFLPDKFIVYANSDSMSFDLKSKEIKMVGVSYKFQGTGSVNGLTISNHEGKPTFVENFE
ncbi:MAG: hypothetical protein KDC99_00630 [Cyclobacteriaceae bacterium]|nr:hypothetical protein [Cyclobacteriaceae bacterium]